ncbi:hypothetical protein [Flavilitoribacter nigricans]|uniref:Uncharacterized protein n=1 Tax=Flavilitoribacter nigricans (strain ATCC 23147 / DSM 23189 / NBRC 102662 / NCIMB 1420 / SS-2) TaxID=1122177 RepID=A0A2D0NC60_FLAN2|nr:hypothetical protein [Flavilitoribacter nigricans]PHN05978.1 hypothetical protein CRP01_13470 [Flavilitoribacter nigricans DSM 23189 = NBRC 102662]
MNWKINYWTVLFAITALGFLIYAFTRPDCPPVGSSPSVCYAPPDTLTPQEAINRLWPYTLFIENYKNTIEEIAKENPKLDSLVSDISNLNLRYFHLPRCELNEMLRRRPDGDAYGYLMLEDDPRNPGKKQISLMFYDKVLPPDINPESLDDDDGTFYDFINPCPTICGGQ